MLWYVARPRSPLPRALKKEWQISALSSRVLPDSGAKTNVTGYPRWGVDHPADEGSQKHD